MSCVDSVHRTTVSHRLEPITATTPRQAHELVESGAITGKVVIGGGFARLP
jgi:hypothetical protein